MDLQTPLALLIVAAAAFFLGRSQLKALGFFPKKRVASGCHGCPKGGACSKTKTF